MSTGFELGRCKVSAEGLNGGRGHAILLTIASWAAGETVKGFPRSPASQSEHANLACATQLFWSIKGKNGKFVVMHGAVFRPSDWSKSLTAADSAAFKQTESPSTFCLHQPSQAER